MHSRLLPMVSSILLILPAAGCSDNQPERPGDPLADTRVEMESLAETHYRSSLGITTPDAMRIETRRYASAMQDLIDIMGDLCSGMRHGGSMTGGHSWDDMEYALGHMADAIAHHENRMENLDDVSAMHEECLEHHGTFMSELHDLDGAMYGDGHGRMHH